MTMTKPLPQRHDRSWLVPIGFCWLLVQAGVVASSEAEILQQLKSPQADLRWRAAVLLGQGDIQHETAARALFDAFVQGDAETRQVASAMLLRLGPSSARELRGRLGHSDPLQRKSALTLLARIGGAMEDETANLVNTVIESSSAEDLARNDVAQALAGLGPDGIPHLVRACEEGKAETDVLRAVLPRLKRRANVHVPALLSHRAVGLRVVAAQHVRDFGHEPAEDVAPLLLAMFRDGSDDESGMAAGSLLRLRIPLTDRVVPMLSATHSSAQRAAAVHLLSDLATEDPDASQAVALALEDDDREVRMAAIESLGRHQHDSELVFAVLRPLLKNDDREIRLAAVESMHRLGDLTPTEQEIMTTALRDPDSDVRAAARRAIDERGYGCGCCTAREHPVNGALRWLTDQQRPDGGWRLCDGDGTSPIRSASDAAGWNDAAATGLATLVFLGAGRMDDPAVDRAVRKLLSRMRPAYPGIDFGDGSHLAHAISTLALCESYALSGDVALHRPAHYALLRIAATQDDQTGGWPMVAGESPQLDSTVWHLMALRSALGSDLQQSISASTLSRVARLLESAPEGGPADDATAWLLSRFLLEAGNAPEALQGNVQQLLSDYDRLAECPQDVFLAAFAAQLASLEYDAPQLWNRWNEASRDALHDQQLLAGKNAGSWNPRSRESAVGGSRFLTTALSALASEVRYRHLPIFAPPQR